MVVGQLLAGRQKTNDTNSPANHGVEADTGQDAFQCGDEHDLFLARFYVWRRRLGPAKLVKDYPEEGNRAHDLDQVVGNGGPIAHVNIHNVRPTTQIAVA